MDTRERIEKIEKEIRETPYHKATERHIGRLKARLAKLRAQSYGKKSGGKKGGKGYAVSKSGDGTVVLVGPPSVGKSTLINALTGAKSKVAEYEFTTLKVIPGMMLYNGAHIQILDVPGLLAGAAKGKGRGREVLSIARIADLILLMADVGRAGMLGKIKEELEEAGVDIEKTPVLSVVNKIDGEAERARIKRMFANETDNTIFISAKNRTGLDRLKRGIWEKLGLIRVYLKNNYGRVDYKKPLIVKAGTTVGEAAEKVSSEIAKQVIGAKIWGKAAIYPNQEVSLDYILADEIILKFIK